MPETAQSLGAGMHRIPIRVQSFSAKPFTTGEIEVVFWTPSQRLSRSLRSGGAVWVAALISIFLPLLHFVLVPLLTLAGPIVAALVYKRESVVLGGQAVCPNCDSALPIARTAYRFPISDLCTACNGQVTLEALAQDSPLTGIHAPS